MLHPKDQRSYSVNPNMAYQNSHIYIDDVVNNTNNMSSSITENTSLQSSQAYYSAQKGRKNNNDSQ